MGKKRIVKKGASVGEGAKRASGPGKLSRRSLERGVLHVESTYNNTKLALADTSGDIVAWSSSGNLGFKGARKGTPFAAAKIGEAMGEKGKLLGLKEVAVIARGVGAGRESAIRAFIAKSGANISSLKDKTPVPFNGPRPPKPRRV